jgi:N-acetyl-gamma-glutamylphosphate reductase
MPAISVVMMGASGAVGGEAVKALAAMPEVERITLLGRRAIAAVPSAHAHVEQHVVDLQDAATYRGHLAGHHVALCALGVGQPSVRVEQLGAAMAKNLLVDGAGVERLRYDDVRRLAPTPP